MEIVVLNCNSFVQLLTTAVRDVHETFRAETETKPRRSKYCPRRDVAASETLAET